MAEAREASLISSRSWSSALAAMTPWRCRASSRRSANRPQALSRAAATASDGVIHLAFKRDIAFSGDFRGAAEADRLGVRTIGDALAGTGRPLVIAAGTPVEPGRTATEDDGHGLDPGRATGPQARAATSEWVLSPASRGVRSSVVRLPGTVHGEGGVGFMAALVRIARDRGISGYFGDETNRWPAVHRLDAARLFHLALEKAPAGSTLHAVADEGVPLRDIADITGRNLNLPVATVAPVDAAEHFAWPAPVLAADQPASSTLTRELLGWQPAQPGLVDDLDEGHYFR
ncbi:3-beta hydroxysteroid dehydrogenase [Streptomyces sp. NPDC127051]|uniref:3-beta hydroxysteroid dehydrogenase n=1 Tax=Streptomyces sp. NPDC127051 TaxID=3347119 RepID=UPI003668101E